MKKLLIVIGLTLSAYSMTSLAARLPGEFKIKEEPSEEDWRYFMSQTHEWRESLWKYHNGLGETYKSWSWAWRIGWIKSCRSKKTGYCGDVFTNAIADDALVVRNEIAKTIGLRFSDTGDSEAIKNLEKMLKDSRNFRNDQPLFIHETILFSLKQIGGDGHKVAAKYAQKFDKLAKYWQRLEKAG